MRENFYATAALKTHQAVGLLPYAMLYRGENGETDENWRAFRIWVRPQIVYSKLEELRVPWRQ